MSSHFDLIISADHPSRTAELRLLDQNGAQIAYRHTDFKAIPISRQQGLFDLRNYLRHYIEPGRAVASVAEVGVCIAEQVLGKEIFQHLWASTAQRSLRIQLPGATEEENHLAAALARVPWELARPATDQPTLAERHLLVRVVHDMDEPRTTSLDLHDDEPLRVLFVFAEARGSRPLAARLERRVLRQLFEREVYPHRRVVAHFLTHGVTRDRLKAQFEENGGYHIVHWSGHGHLNVLELARAGGGRDHLTGTELLDLFGGFIPRLFFLSACHSGDILRVKDWNEFLAVAQGKEPGTKQTIPAEPETKDLKLDNRPGYTGTAHALLHGGVPSVVAMRYEVNDEYARDLAFEFYRALLVHTRPKTVAAALTLARAALLDPKQHEPARYFAGDHATPVLYGAEDPGLTLRSGRSPALDTRNPRLHRITELTTAGHEHFVGRTWELAALGAEFIGSRAGEEVKSIGLVTGLGGMGKTALTAEALALWESRFQWVLLYQAKPTALGFEATLRDIHMKLYGERGRYYEHVQSHPADAIHRPADKDFTGPERLERLAQNLVRALRDEPILLVLDNFENNLKGQPVPNPANSEPLWACQDPAWDHCISLLAAELVGTFSRALITCRRPLAALAGTACHRVLLGPLLAGEAALYLREHVGLRNMLFSGEVGERALAMRLLAASRFHPLLMDRLARLAAGGPGLRSQLMQALEALEKSHNYAHLPALFATVPGDAKELTYLSDAMAASLDRLIQDATPDARRLLWMIAVANDPVTLGLLKGAWSGENFRDQQLRGIKQLLATLSQLPPELQAKLKDMPAELRARIDALPPEAPARPDPVALVRYLIAVGLVTEERDGRDDENPNLTCHELVRERIRRWMLDHPQERADLTENAIRLAYAERLEAVFLRLQHEDLAWALDAGSRALIYCVQAGAYDRLASFASAVVTGGGDPRRVAAFVPHLEAAAESAPDGEARWSCLGYLADGLRHAGRPDASLPLYEQAVALARATAFKTQGEQSRRAWSDLDWIYGNWANALLETGDLGGARRMRIESTEASRNAGNPAIQLIANEVEALRIDVKQGQAATALPKIEEIRSKVQGWWEQHRSGKKVPEAPDPEFLVRVVIGTLDVAAIAHFALQQWDSALPVIDHQMRIWGELNRPAEEIAGTRMNRAVALEALGRFGEAKEEFEHCLHVFENNHHARAKVLSSLAGLFNSQGDIMEGIVQERRALAIREQLPDPDDRATSHHNLAIYLHKSGAPSAIAEAARHRLAALVYNFVAGLGQHLMTSIGNYVVAYRRAHAAGKPLVVPRVADLLADPAFRPLADWLRHRGADVAEVQAAMDRLLEQARKAALEKK